MEENNLAAQIRPLEAFAAANPALYRFRVALLASLGYVYLLVLVALLLGIVAAALLYARLNAGIIKLLWIPLVLVGLVLRAMWVTIPEPDGKELQKSDAPALFELIDEITTALNGPKVHRVLLSDEFNASILQIPQFGMFGWLRNYLVVGLPLMRALSPEEFRSVLAHEFGHLSGKHGRFSGWIYRVRQTWVQILTRVHEERSYASFMFEPFLKWYAPYLNAYSFVLARAQEREADTYSVDLAGKNVAALALTRLTTKQRVLNDDFWPTFFRGAKEQSLAPRDTFTQMLSGVEQSIGHAKAQKWFLEALRVTTGYEDTHPALGDRLAAIGFAKDSPELKSLVEEVVKADELKETAAARYLRQLPEDFEPSMNRLWRERIAQYWSERHEEIKKTRKRLAEFDQQAKTRQLTVEEQWERAIALSEIEDRAASLPAIKAVLNEAPDHIGANFALGSILLEQGNADGIQYLEKTIESDADVAGQACELISDFYVQQRNEELAETFRNRSAEYYDKALQLKVRAFTFSKDDQFLPHDLAPDRLQKLQAELQNIHGLNAAFLVRKVIEGSEPVYVLAVMAAYTWKDGQNAMHVDQLFEDLSTNVELPSPIVMLSLDGERTYLINPIANVPGAQVFATPEARLAYRH